MVRVGTRASALARLQTDIVLERLRPLHPDLDFQAVTITTHGDANATAPLAGMGLGVFVKEIEQQLLSGQLDMAVHSLKDMPTLLPDGLALAALLPREDPRDVLVNVYGSSVGAIARGRPHWDQQSPPAVPASEPPARPAGSAHSRQRGDTAAQGRRRGVRGGRCWRPPACCGWGWGTGLPSTCRRRALCRRRDRAYWRWKPASGDDRMVGILKTIDHASTRYAATAERAFLERLGGGCQVPVGAYAQSDGDLMNLTVFLGTPDGSQSFQAKVRGLTRSPHQLAADAHLAMVERGGGRLLEDASR